MELSKNTKPELTSEYRSSNPHEASQGVYDQINNFYSEQNQQEKIVQEAREVLGESSSNLSDEQIYDLVTEMQYLVDTWIEEFEKNVFEGKTLNEVLQCKP